MTEPTSRDPLFQDMAEQMRPDADLRRRLDERLAAEPAGQQASTRTRRKQSAAGPLGGAGERADYPGPARSRWSRPSTWLAAAAAVVVAVGIGGGTVVALRGHSTPHVAVSTPASTPPTPADYATLYEAVTQTMATRTTPTVEDYSLPDTQQGVPTPATIPAPATGDYTTTNVQVAGIDEADVVKTDGSTLYAAADQHVTVVGLDGPGTHTLARIDTGQTGWVVDLLLDDGTLVVIVQEYPAVDVTPYPAYPDDGIPVPAPGRAASAPPQTVVQLYDVTDPSAPTLRATARQSGSYRTARLWQGTVYLVSDYSLGSQQPDPDDPSTFVPLVGGADGTEPLAPGDVTVLPCPDAPRYGVVTAVDVRTGARTGQQAVLGGADTVYMSAANLYLGGTSYPTVAVPDVPPGTPDPLVDPVPARPSAPTTSLARLSLADGGLTVAAQGSVPGTLVDQFALDEYDGRLRVVTTSRDGWTDVAGLYVLGPDLRQVGAVSDLAHDEQVKSVRFAGTVGYVVTYRQTDPLFAVDLSDPAQPTVMSALKIPGFSTYLHPWGTDRLVGLGYGGTGAGLTGGLKLSLFDVGDPYAVTETRSVAVPGDWSEALDDHRAVLVDADRGLLGFPVSTSSTLHYVVYQVDATAGFTLVHDLVAPGGSMVSFSDVRAVRAGDHLYVSWNSGLDVYQLATGTLVAHADLG